MFLLKRNYHNNGCNSKSKEVQTQSNKHCDAKHCILPSMYAGHLGSRRYILDLQTVTTDMAASVPLWHQGLYPSVEEIGVKCSLINDKFMLASVANCLPVRCF